ncbi:MAG: hypothetical protein DRN78_00305 [Thermoproteota archaeon]|nr:MAG: hypothetical protein DRN78_00305 [Candidatus Korarchaeota archaeon]
MPVKLIDLLGYLFISLIPIAIQTFFLWVAQIFVMEERHGFLSLMGLVIAGNFLSGLVYLVVTKFASVYTPVPSILGTVSMFAIWIAVIKAWYGTTWSRAFLLMVMAGVLELLTLYLAVPVESGLRPFTHF